MTVEYLDLADFVNIAAAVTGPGVDTVMKVANLDLADSALHAPAAGFDDTDLYPDFVDKAAVLVVRLAKNHPVLQPQRDELHLVSRQRVSLCAWRPRPRPRGGTVDRSEDRS